MFYTGDMAMTPPPQSTYVIRFASKCVRRLYQTIECIDQRLLLRAQCTIHGVPTGCYVAHASINSRTITTARLVCKSPCLPAGHKREELGAPDCLWIARDDSMMVAFPAHATITRH